MATKPKDDTKSTGGAIVTTASTLPAFMRSDAGRGLENVNSEDMELPRIKLVQGIDNDLLGTHDDVKAGDFWHILAEKSLGSSVDIVPLYIDKRYVLWAPRPPIDKGGILARADDGVHWVPPDKSFTVKIDKRGTQVTWTTKDTVAKSGLAEWGTYDPNDAESQPAATQCYVIVVALPAYPELGPVALFLQRSAVPMARKLLGKLNISRAPIFGCVYTMKSFVDTSDAGSFNNYSFTANGFVADQEAYKEYEQLHEQFKKIKIKIKDLEGAQEADVTETGGGVVDDNEIPF